jgi:hypothetical protein
MQLYTLSERLPMTFALTGSVWPRHPVRQEFTVMSDDPLAFVYEEDVLFQTAWTPDGPLDFNAMRVSEQELRQSREDDCKATCTAQKARDDNLCKRRTAELYTVAKVTEAAAGLALYGTVGLLTRRVGTAQPDKLLQTAIAVGGIAGGGMAELAGKHSEYCNMNASTTEIECNRVTCAPRHRGACPELGWRLLMNHWWPALLWFSAFALFIWRLVRHRRWKKTRLVEAQRLVSSMRSLPPQQGTKL